MRGVVAVTLSLGLALCSVSPVVGQDVEQGGGAGAAADGEATTGLAQRARNPIANAASLPFQYNANFGFGPNRVTRNVLNIQPLLPVNLSEKWSVVVRPVVPIIWQGAPAPGLGSAAGLGDSNLQFYFTPNAPAKWIWGVGPAILLPTATERDLGSGKWGAGPAAVVLRIDGQWLYGALANQVWSFGHNDRPDVNGFSFQPFVTYVIPKGKGWYLTSNPLLTANWEAGGGDVWTVPVGGGVGRVFPGGRGRPSLDLTLQGYYNLVRPDSGPQWQTRFVVQLLFPARR